MPVIRFLRTQLQTSCPTIHAKRLNVLVTAIDTVTRHHRLTLTELGRALRSSTLVKHNIKRIDRLLGNGRLHAERTAMYAVVTQWLLAKVMHPIVLVDWSDLTPDHQWHVLRASLAVGGRAMTIYEEVHPLQSLTNRRVHQGFLAQLAKILPRGRPPIVVTDAGFRGTWFRLVEALGWHWVGRIRNRTLVQQAGEDMWRPCKHFYPTATAHPRTLGEVQLVRSHPLRCILHLVRQSPKGRIHKSVLGHPIRAAASRKIAVREREPWLIAASISLREQTAQRIMTIYRARMQIEEAFRDLKSERYGLGFSASQTRTPHRLAILLLIGALALFVLWLVGHVAVHRRLQFGYQSNTTKTRAVLSIVYLGRQIMRRASGGITRQSLVHAISRLQRHLATVHEV